jgi:hypothetical protein
MNFDWKAFVIRIAPTLGSVLQGPLSGVAVAFLAGKLLDGPVDDQDAALSEILGAQTPEILAKVIALDGEFKASLNALNIDESILRDVANAREREMTLRDHTPAALAACITAGLFAIIFLLIFVPLPQDSMNIVNIMLGSLSTAWMTVISYYFGSVKTPSVVPAKLKK